MQLATFQKVSYSALAGFLIISCLIFILYVLGYGQELWRWYYNAYFAVAFIHTWYIFILLFISDRKKNQYEQDLHKHIGVVIPCYNEDEGLLRQTIEAVLKADGKKLLVLVDDGSTNNSLVVMQEYAKENENVRVIEQPENKGKRHALHTAITSQLIADCEYIVLLDSDTVVEPEGLMRITEPLSQSRIGTVGGQIRVLNERQNVLTRMVGAYYWSALNIHRKAQSALGMVSCCSGAFVAYRKEVIQSVIDDFLTATFMGIECNGSTDRHLTNLVLKKGLDAVYVDDAVAHTITPHTMKAFLRQQLRWRRGFLRESIYALSFTFDKKPVLFFELLIWEMVTPFLAFGIVLLIILHAIFNPSFLLIALIPSIIFLAFVRNAPILFLEPKKIPALLAFAFFSLFVMYWQTLYALATLKERRWMTRGV